MRENKGYIKLFQSKYGRFVVLICYDAEHAQMTSTLRAISTGQGSRLYLIHPCIMHQNESREFCSHCGNSPTCGRLVNNSPKAGSFIFNGTVSSFNKHNAHRYFMTVDLGRLRSLRPSGDEKCATNKTLTDC